MIAQFFYFLIKDHRTNPATYSVVKDRFASNLEAFKYADDNLEHTDCHVFVYTQDEFIEFIKVLVGGI